MTKLILKILVLGLMAAFVYGYFFLTVFSTQPIGMLPDGSTVIGQRLENGVLFDSADAMCFRNLGQVNLICRMAMLNAYLDNADVYIRLPYFEWAYLHSTDGRIFDR